MIWLADTTTSDHRKPLLLRRILKHPLDPDDKKDSQQTHPQSSSKYFF